MRDISLRDKRRERLNHAKINKHVQIHNYPPLFLPLQTAEISIWHGGERKPAGSEMDIKSRLLLHFILFWCLCPPATSHLSPPGRLSTPPLQDGRTWLSEGFVFLQSHSTKLSLVDPSTDDSRHFSVNMNIIIECDNGIIVDHSDNPYLKVWE